MEDRSSNEEFKAESVDKVEANVPGGKPAGFEEHEVMQGAGKQVLFGGGRIGDTQYAPFESFVPKNTVWRSHSFRGSSSNFPRKYPVCGECEAIRSEAKDFPIQEMSLNLPRFYRKSVECLECDAIRSEGKNFLFEEMSSNLPGSSRKSVECLEYEAIQGERKNFRVGSKEKYLLDVQDERNQMKVKRDTSKLKDVSVDLENDPVHTSVTSKHAQIKTGDSRVESVKQTTTTGIIVGLVFCIIFLSLIALFLIVLFYFKGEI